MLISAQAPLCWQSSGIVRGRAMKKTLLLIACLLWFPVSSIAAPPACTQAVSSGVISTSSVAVLGPARLTDCSVYTDGVHNVTLTIYDNATSASGNVLAQVTVTGASLVGGCFMPIPEQVSAGIYVSISGTGGSVLVSYCKP